MDEVEALRRVADAASEVSFVTAEGSFAPEVVDALEELDEALADLGAVEEGT